MQQLTPLLCIGAAFLSASCAQAAQPDPLQAEFANPPSSVRPMLRWWWPGGNVTKQGIEAELQAAIDAGFGSVEIQPFRAGLFDASGSEAARIDSYGSPEFFQRIGDAARYAQAHGVSVDYTFGSGWPSGGTPIVPEQAVLELRSAARTIAGPVHFSGSVPMPMPHGPAALEKIMPPPAGQAWPADYTHRLAARSKVVAVLAIQGDAPIMRPRSTEPNSFFPPPDDVAQSGTLRAGTTIDLTARVTADGQLDWQVPAGSWQLITLVQQAEGRKVALAAGVGPQLVLDHLDAGAFTTYAGWHADRLAPLQSLVGHGLRSVFVDSFELDPENPWSADFMAQFRARRGYDLTPYLPLILLPGWMQPYAPEASHPLYVMGDVGPRIREDYHRTVSELMQERFFAPLRDWSHAHGFSLRLQAHGAQADLISTYAFADVPETEDLFAGPSADFFNYARSAADIYGKPFASAESMIILGHALDSTPAMYKGRADLLFAGGIAQLVEHGMPYSEARSGSIGWAPFGSLFGNEFDPANPLFGFLRPLTDYEARVGVILRSTKPVVPVVIFQGQLFQHAVTDQANPPTDSLRTSLHQAGYSADTMTLDGLLKSHGEHDQIVTLGGARYSALLIADQPALDPRAADMLAAAAAKGLKILLVGQIPSRAPGLAAAGLNETVRADVARFGLSSTTVIKPPEIAQALRAAGIRPNLHFASSAIPQYAERTDGARHFIFLANPAQTPLRVSFAVPYKGQVQDWHPWTGRVSAGSAQADSDGLRFTTTLPAFGSALLSVDTSVPFHAREPVSTQQAALQDIAPAAWQITASGFNAAAQTVDTSFSLGQLQDWSSVSQLGKFSGHVSYSAQFTLAPPTRSRLLLDLGEVHDAARVSLNGCTAGLVMAPWLVDVTGAVRHGRNDLTVVVANMPMNGMLGHKLGFMPPIAGGTEPAGLLGPVRLLGSTMPGADVPALTCKRPDKVGGGPRPL